MNPDYTIIRLLADGRFHSGEGLAARLGISRASVWKRLRQVEQQLGLDIHAVRGRGYRLAQPLELLDEALLRAGLDRSVLERIDRIDLHDHIDSTNSYLMGLAPEQQHPVQVCLAELQTAGRGRRGRAWVSPYGCNIYLSIGWLYPMGPGHLSGLSLLAGIAVVRALESLGIEGAGLKWPNDILREGRKLAGLLLEVSGEHAGPSRVVLGLGFNLRLSREAARAIDQPWIDLASIPGSAGIGRNRLAAQLLNQLIAMLGRFEGEGLAPWVEEWTRLDLYYGQPVILQMGQRRVAGVHQGIDPSGALLLESQGALQTFHGGEISLRPGGAG
ncbi:MAG: bifunctional biotin--[acetyl-CoA-carboxylase] ligase/biotin operon repressor BirA [gamma proteobacterium symbiont of Phacoides pectinatus]